MNRIASIRPTDLTGLAWSSLKRNPLRSSLTIGAVALGIAVMMYLISLGLGLEQLTIGQVGQSDALLSLTVNAVNAEQRPLDQKSVKEIAAVKNVDAVLPDLTLDGQVTLESKNATITLQAVDPKFLGVSDTTKLTAGRYFRGDDRNVMVVTTGFLKIFGLDANKVPLVTFRILPNQEKYPNVAAIEDVSVSGIVSDETAQQAYLPRTYVEELVGAAEPPYTTAKVKVAKLDDVPAVADGVRRLGFRVDSVTDTVSQIKQIFKYVQWTLGVLGGIAIAVASIGMFNTLTISLLERTKEIGIMKALGVRRGDIRRLFLTEAVLMGLFGGILGILLAFLFQQLTLFIFSLLASYLDGTVPKLFQNDLYVVGGFLLFGIAIAFLTGLYPARRAMRLRPIDAIRTE